MRIQHIPVFHVMTFFKAKRVWKYVYKNVTTIFFRQALIGTNRPNV